ncbi:tRNA (adenosine(37)-N6)-threonylcarbamoyltransferase complex transferase subunit TsaD [Candidatus Saccharibacteria bacterium]|nr:tRNA (adenosine(37)-N6)-threonylcarbamoyltransferase complex transferase subunit TsaD [Candidatus Saccharibacteria bacterium]
MNILAIESSCDETACAILHDTTLLSNVVVSQIDIFKAYGGVIPEVAARNHLEAILPVIDKAISDAKTSWKDIGAIAVTHTPGLLGSLLIGTLTARTFAILHDKPLYAIHHLKSHIYSNWIEQNSSVAPKFPLLALVISGGHTQIIYMKEHNSFEIIGTTLDDAVGECFDKVAKILGLPYPGGPSIAKAAEKGNPDKYKFPHPKIDNLNFSFSGLKTAVLRTVQKTCSVSLDYPSHDLKNLLTSEQIADFAASFQKTAVDILLEKLVLAETKYENIKSIVFAGGVSANKALRKKANEIFSSLETSIEVSKENQPEPFKKRKNTANESPRIYFPAPQFSGDNAAMVAIAAYYEIQSGIEPTNPYTLDISPRSNIS